MDSDTGKSALPVSCSEAACNRNSRLRQLKPTYWQQRRQLYVEKPFMKFVKYIKSHCLCFIKFLLNLNLVIHNLRKNVSQVQETQAESTVIAA